MLQRLLSKSTWLSIVLTEKYNGSTWPKSKEKGEGMMIKGSGEENNLDHQAICLILQRGIVMKYDTEGLATQQCAWCDDSVRSSKTPVTYKRDWKRQCESKPWAAVGTKNLLKWFMTHWEHTPSLCGPPASVPQQGKNSKDLFYIRL